jgi:hypothetical protein
MPGSNYQHGKFCAIDNLARDIANHIPVEFVNRRPGTAHHKIVVGSLQFFQQLRDHISMAKPNLAEHAELFQQSLLVT